MTLWKLINMEYQSLFQKKIKFPDIFLVPLVAFDNRLNRIGYGGGFYDRYLEKIQKNKKIVTIGLAYSFQEIKRSPS